MTDIDSFVSKILVIDEDEPLNQLFCEFLIAKGFMALSAYSLQQAKEIIVSEKSVDLILLDYPVSDGTGVELLVSLSECLKENHTPIIMVNENDDPAFLESCFVWGVADYIIKPVNLSLLALKVGALIASVSMQKLIRSQNEDLERFKQEAEREESIAKFTYEYLLKQNSKMIDGVSVWLQSSSSFSGDVALAKISPGGDLYFILGDATGHGLSAAITVMPVVSIFNSMVSKGFHIQPIAMELNERLIRDTPDDRFVAAIIIQIRRETNEIEVWNGGMPTVYWVNNGEVIHEFKSRHMALGILEGNRFDASVETCALKGVGEILLYSDGLIEQVDCNSDSFSADRIRGVIAKNPENLQSALIEALVDHVGGRQYHDDVSICVLKPDVYLASRQKQLKEKFNNAYEQGEVSDFSWNVKISGKNILHCDLPSLCNKFLRSLDVNQFFCQVVFLVAGEMVSNAIDHGILGLSSSRKRDVNGLTLYFAERERRLKELKKSDFVELSLIWKFEEGGPLLYLSVQDSGSGYPYEEIISQGEASASGRGLKLIRGLSKNLEIVAPGNLIRAVISPL